MPIRSETGEARRQATDAEGEAESNRVWNNATVID